MAEGLNCLEIESRGGSPNRTAFVLHGILGSAKNWRTFGRRLVDRFPHWRVVLVDLRNHGDSPAYQGENTLRMCAADLVKLSRGLGYRPSTVIGHSFGGKVALEWARSEEADGRVTWVLDTNPAAAMDDAERISSGHVVNVLRALDKVPQPLATREDLVSWLRDRGFSQTLANWMTTNLHRAEDGFRWRFNLPGVKEMIADYARVDMLDTLEVGGFHGRVELLRAGHTVWPEADVLRLQRMSDDADKAFTYHVLPDSGHWVHVEKPVELLALMSRSFAS